MRLPKVKLGGLKKFIPPVWYSTFLAGFSLFAMAFAVAGKSYFTEGDEAMGTIVVLCVGQIMMVLAVAEKRKQNAAKEE